MTTSLRPSSPTRRSLMRGASWAAPAGIVGLAAPAFAASPVCATQDVTLNWGFAKYSGTPSMTSGFTTTVDFTPNPPSSTHPKLNSPLRATIVHSYFGQAQGHATNGTITSFHVGGTGQVGYYIRQKIGANGSTTPTAADYQTIRFTFGETVSNLRFSITDIDRAWGSIRDFVDGVTLTSDAPFTASVPSGSTVTGKGTAGSSWQNSVDGNKGEDKPGGQIDIAFTKPVTSFTIRYDNLGREAITPNVLNDQSIFVTGFRANRPTQC